MLLFTDALLVLLAALAIDAIVGDPDAVWRRWPHPVTCIGAMIAALDRRLNREGDPAGMRRAAGVLALAVLLAAAAGAGSALEIGLRALPVGEALLALVASVFIAQRSLHDHVGRVANAFAREGLTGARRAVSMIVGRDPASLDEAGVSRAAIESCAENFSDGVVAPAFWFAILGLPGLIAYKAVNTADSMIGHRTARHDAFGWASARCDDLLNLVPARLAGLFLALAAPAVRGSVRAACAVMLRDARLHRSPNAGWPESAMAGALGIALVGPRRYGERVVEDPFLNAQGGREAAPKDIHRALRVLVAACLLQALVVGALYLAT